MTDFPTLRQMENLLFLAALQISGGNRTHAARLLGVSVKTVRARLARYLQGSTINMPVFVGQVVPPKMGDRSLRDFMESLLDFDLLKKYREFTRRLSKGPKITFERLILMPGAQRAKVLRANPVAKEMYAKRVQRV